MSTIFKLSLKLILCFLFFIFLFTFTLLVRNTFLPRYPILRHPKDYGIEYKDVSFLTEDNFNLKGWLIVKDQVSPLIILCHSLGTNKSDVLEFVSFLYEAGYNLFLFDFRAHGESSGFVTSFGYREIRDLKAAVRYLEKIGFKRFGIFGISMGGSVAIMAAESSKNIKAIVADTPYIDLDRTITDYANLLLPFFGRFLGRFAVLSYRLRFLVDSRKVSPLKIVKEISVPLFIINGGDDNRMLPSYAQSLYGQANLPKEIWLTPDAGHLESFWVKREEYIQRVLNFFGENLR